MTQPSDRFLNFWLYYGAEEGMKDKGTRSQAWISWEKAIKSSGTDEVEFSQNLASGYKGYMKNRLALKGAGEFVRKMKMASTFLNQEAWNDVYEESTGSLLQREVQKDCSHCKGEGFYVSNDEVLCKNHYLEEFVYPKHRVIMQELTELYPKTEATWQEWALKTLKVIEGRLENE
jgi:hypothetical protein